MTEQDPDSNARVENVEEVSAEQPVNEQMEASQYQGQNPEDDGRWDKQKAETIGAVMLEGSNISRGGGREKQPFSVTSEVYNFKPMNQFARALKVEDWDLPFLRNTYEVEKERESLRDALANYGEDGLEDGHGALSRREQRRRYEELLELLDGIAEPSRDELVNNAHSVAAKPFEKLYDQNPEYANHMETREFVEKAREYDELNEELSGALDGVKRANRLMDSMYLVILADGDSKEKSNTEEFKSIKMLNDLSGSSLELDWHNLVDEYYVRRHLLPASGVDGDGLYGKWKDDEHDTANSRSSELKEATGSEYVYLVVKSEFDSISEKDFLLSPKDKLDLISRVIQKARRIYEEKVDATRKKIAEFESSFASKAEYSNPES